MDAFCPPFRAGRAEGSGAGWLPALPAPASGAPGPPTPPHSPLTHSRALGITWLQMASSRATLSVVPFMAAAVEGLAPCSGLALVSVRAVEILLLSVWSAVLPKAPSPQPHFSPGALRLCSRRDPVYREIFPSSATLTARAKGTSDSGLSFTTHQLSSGKRERGEPSCFLSGGGCRGQRPAVTLRGSGSCPCAQPGAAWWWRWR